MRKSVPVQNEGFIAQRNPIRALRKMFETWIRTVREEANSRKRDAIVQQLSLHLQHDIGANDYRPAPPSLNSIQMDDASRLQATRSRLI